MIAIALGSNDRLEPVVIKVRGTKDELLKVKKALKELNVPLIDNFGVLKEEEL